MNLQERIIDLLKKGSWTSSGIAGKLEESKFEVAKALLSLEKKGSIKIQKNLLFDDVFQLIKEVEPVEFESEKQYRFGPVENLTLKNRILDILGNGPLSLEDIKDKFNSDHRRGVVNYIDQMEKDGFIEPFTTDHYPYSILIGIPDKKEDRNKNDQESDDIFKEFYDHMAEVIDIITDEIVKETNAVEEESESTRFVLEKDEIELLISIAKQGGSKLEPFFSPGYALVRHNLIVKLSGKYILSNRGRDFLFNHFLFGPKW